MAFLFFFLRDDALVEPLTNITILTSSTALRDETDNQHQHGVTVPKQ